MPIFEKNGRRIFFAHIPKTGGTSIYLAFVAAGWRIINLSEWDNPRSTFTALKEQFGITSIERRGLSIGLIGPPQHMPAIVWRTWGSFDESFAIVRQPEERLESALAYHHQLTNTQEPLAEYLERILTEVEQRFFGTWRRLGGHLIPQHHFVIRSTRIFRFEEDWAGQVSERYGLDHTQFPCMNSRRKDARGFLGEAHRAWARRTYQNDYACFGYQ